MNRRTFVSGVSLGILSASLVSEAQQGGKVFRIGILGNAPREQSLPFINAFKDGLRELGYEDGRNIAFDLRTADGRRERLPAVAAELVALTPDVIVTSSNEVTAAARQATAVIPIVMAIGGDPVGLGFIASLARPGGNITGLTFDAEPDAYAKPLEFLKETMPTLARVQVLLGPYGWEAMRRSASEAATRLGLTLRYVVISGPGDIEPAFAAMKKDHVRAFVLWPDVTIYPARKQVADAGLREKIVGVSIARQFTDVGGLMSYGPNARDLFRRAAVYVDKILKGAKAGELPVEQPTKFELVINLRTAKALRLQIPQSLLLRADEVIE